MELSSYGIMVSLAGIITEDLHYSPSRPTPPFLRKNVILEILGLIFRFCPEAID